jgi:hypothetical protein
VTAQPIAPVIPSLARPTGRGRARMATARRLPLAAVPEIPAAADDVIYGFGRIDAAVAKFPDDLQAPGCSGERLMLRHWSRKTSA